MREELNLEMAEETEDLEEKEPFVPSPKWKRVTAWVLFGLMVLGIITWLLNIAYPQWIDVVKGWFA